MVVFSRFKNIRKVKYLTLTLVDSICFKNAMLVDDKFKKGKLGKPRAKSQPLETSGNYITLEGKFNWC